MRQMPQEEQDKPKPVALSRQVRATARSSAKIRVRLIRQSPVMDPKKVASARESALKLKQKKLAELENELKLKKKKSDESSQADDLDDLEIPFITPGL
jgi:hypothetical protein